MTVKGSKGSELLAEITALCGVIAGNPVEKISADFLRRLTQKQLHELAKRLSISGYSRLNKDALATRLWVEVEPVVDGNNHELPPQVPQVPQVPNERPAMKANAEANALSSPGSGSGSEASLDSRPAERGQPGRENPVSQRFEESAHAPPVVHEFEILPKEIPWGYGHDRVTAMPVDPERLFVYWEVLEDSIAKARTRLGAGGPTAWLNVRLYDTSGRIFDGTNAHANIDQRVERETRQWFFDIGKPTSELIAEVGLLSSEGFFAKIARSGRVEFPRREPAPWSEPEWMTVRASTGHVERSNVRSQVKSTGSAVPGAQPPVGLEGLPGWLLKHVEWQDVARFAQGGPGGGAGVEERVEWEELRTDGTLAVHRRISWESPTMITSWESGPFAYPVEVPLPVREAFVGKTRVFKLGDRTHIVYGPWQVVIRGMAAHQSRAVLARWEVFRSWQTTSTHVVQSFETSATGGEGASERAYRGSSEMSYVGSSELKFGGASELFFLGASELRLGGASEMMFAAASENILRGSSERRFMGSSESRRMGGSESRLLGGSEARLAAGSEPRLADGARDYPILNSSSSSSGPSGNG